MPPIALVVGLFDVKGACQAVLRSKIQLIRNSQECLVGFHPALLRRHVHSGRTGPNSHCRADSQDRPSPPRTHAIHFPIEGVLTITKRTQTQAMFQALLGPNVLGARKCLVPHMLRAGLFEDQGVQRRAVMRTSWYNVIYCNVIYVRSMETFGVWHRGEILFGCFLFFLLSASLSLQKGWSYPDVAKERGHCPNVFVQE